MPERLAFATNVRVAGEGPPAEANARAIPVEEVREPAPEATARPVLRLSLFGPVTIHLGQREVRAKSLKLRAILGYIAMTEAFRETRERLVGLFWSESSEDRARAVLRQVVKELRAILAAAGFDGLRADAREIGFDHADIEVDVRDVIAAAEAGVAHPLLLERPRLADELMAGLDDLDPAFRAWVVARRETIRDRLLRALEATLAAGGEQARTAEAILNLDPTHERACRRLMHARAAAGDVAGALRAYNALWELLGADYDMEPAPETQRLVAEIKAGTFVAEPPAASNEAVPAGTAPARAPRRTAALPETRLRLSVGETISYVTEPDKAHLVIGFRQHLIASLVRFREWQVTDAPLPAAVIEAAGATGGAYDLQMTAYHVGPAVHLLFNLKELESNRYVWSDGFELNLESWFAAQRRVVRRVAMALDVNLSAERLRRISSQPDVPTGIYDQWLQCQTLIRTFSAAYHEQASRQFAEIIRAAPNFVPAYCGLIDLRNTRHISCPGVFRGRDAERAALELAREAVRIDPSNPAAQRSLAWSVAMSKQYAQAITHIELAHELNPNDSWTLISAALLLAFCGEPERALALLEPALEPAAAPSRTHWAYHFDIQFLAGNYEAALASAENAHDVLHGNRSAWKAAAYAQLHRRNEAVAEADRFFAHVRGQWVGAEPATDEAIVRWFLHLYPIRRREVWERLRDGLRWIGLPTGTMAHHDW